jgi:hypothetical protein
MLQWQQRLSANASDESPTDFNIDPEEENNSDEDTNEYQLLLETFDNLNSLYPTTGYEQLESNSTPINQIARLGPTPTVSTIAKLVRESLPLNKKLFLVVEMILDHVRVRPRLGLSPLAYRPHTDSSSFPSSYDVLLVFLISCLMSCLFDSVHNESAFVS